MTDFSPREIVSELDRYIVGQNDAKRAVAIALAQPLAAAAARRQIARGSAAEKHPDDRPDRRRQNRDLAPPGQARRRAIPQGRGHQIYRSRLCRPRRRADHPRSGRDRHRARPRTKTQRRAGARRAVGAEERVLDALVGPGASPATRESFRKRLRAGELNDKEIEIEVQAGGGGGMPMFEIPGMPGAQMGAINIGDIFGKLGGGTHQDAARHRGGIARDSGQRGIRQAARQRAAGAGSDQGGRTERHRVPRRDRQDRRTRRPRAPTCRARACSATCCR